jgi:hypothetical protein
MQSGGLADTAGNTHAAAMTTTEGNQHPDRDAQFRYLAAQVRALPLDMHPFHPDWRSE